MVKTPQPSIPDLVYIGSGFLPDIPARDLDAAALALLAAASDMLPRALVDMLITSGLYRAADTPAPPAPAPAPVPPPALEEPTNSL